jgi:hypothetical protein
LAIPPSSTVWCNNAHRIEMRGESMRKKHNPPSLENKE